MKRNYLSGIIGFFALITSPAQTNFVEWAMPLWSDAQDIPRHIITDAQDNIYTAIEVHPTASSGEFQIFHFHNMLTLYYPEETYYPIPGNYFIADAILTKQAPNGQLLWAKRSQGPDKEIIRGIAVDSQQNVIYGGEIQGEGARFLSESYDLPFAANQNGLLAKLDENGNLLWEKVIEADMTDFDYGTYFDPNGIKFYDVAVDSEDNIYGYISFSARSVNIDGVTFSHQGGPNNYTGDLIITKFDPDGNLIWARHIYSNTIDEPGRITFDTGGNLIVTGNSFDQTYYDNTAHPDTDGNVFVAKIDPQDGNLIWLTKPQGIWLPSLTTGPDSSIYIAGALDTGTFEFAGEPLVNENQHLSNHLAVIMKFDTEGNEVWARKAGPNGSIAAGRYARSYDVQINQYGNPVMVGEYTTDDMYFDSDTFIMNTDPNSNSSWSADIFMAEYSPLGDVLQVKGMGSYGSQGLDRIAFNSQGRLFALGSYRGFALLDFHYIEGGDSALSDAFIMTMSSFGTLGVTDNALPEKLSVFPNPAVDIIHIYGLGAAISVAELFDANGKLINSKTVSASDNRINLSGLASGVYFLKVEKNARQQTLRIIKK